MIRDTTKKMSESKI